MYTFISAMLLFDQPKFHVPYCWKLNQYFYMPGIADDTLFTMTCADWIEWNVTSQNLKYEYRIASYGSDRYVQVPESLVRKQQLFTSTYRF